MLSGQLIESIERMKAAVKWKRSPDIKSAFVGSIAGVEILIAPDTGEAAFMAAVRADDSVLATDGFRACPILASIYDHARAVVS
jgi:hypothetical protein